MAPTPLPQAADATPYGAPLRAFVNMVLQQPQRGNYAVVGLEPGAQRAPETGRLLVLREYQNHGQQSTGFVLVINLAGERGDFRAYQGVGTSRTWRDCAEDIAAHGNRIKPDLAAFLFPELPWQSRWAAA